MTVGISTACFYPNLTENSVEMLGKHGVKNIEVFINSRSETNVRFLNKVKRTADSYGVKIVAVHSFFCAYEPYLIFSDYERRFDDCLPFIDSLFDAGAVLGAELAVIHGGKDSGNISDQTYFERFEMLWQRGREVGVTLAQENVNLYKSQSPDFIRKMRDSLGDKASFVLDVKQCVRDDVDIYEMAEAMGNRLAHIHLSDHNSISDCLLPGKGEFDFAKFLYSSDAVKKASKMVEVYNNAYRSVDEVIAAAEFLNSL